MLQSVYILGGWQYNSESLSSCPSPEGRLCFDPVDEGLDRGSSTFFFREPAGDLGVIVLSLREILHEYDYRERTLVHPALPLGHKPPHINTQLGYVRNQPTSTIDPGLPFVNDATQHLACRCDFPIKDSSVALQPYRCDS